MMSFDRIIRLVEESKNIPTDLNELFRKLGISVLLSEKIPNSLDGIPGNPMCVYIATKDGRKCIFYSRDAMNPRVSERMWIVKTLAKCVIDQPDNFYLTDRTVLDRYEKEFVYQVLIPREKLKEVLNKLLLPTTYSLAEVFMVPQGFVCEVLKFYNITDKIAGYNY